MALITTSKALGWYGIHGTSECADLSLPATFGTYNSSGQFQVGTSGLSESNAEDLTIWTMTTQGSAYYWNVMAEKRWRANQSFLLALLEKLECGQMYWFDWKGSGQLNVPGFVPTAMGVDMGRITA